MQGLYRAIIKLGEQNENRGHRRQRTHRKKAREEPSSAGPRGGGGITIIGRQHRHWRGTGASAGGRSGGRRCRECTLLGGQGSSGVFRDVGSQPPGRGSRRGRWPSCSVVGRWHRPPARE